MSRGAHKFKQGDVTKAIKGVVNAGLPVARVEIDRKRKVRRVHWPPRRQGAGQRVGRRAVKRKNPKYTHGFIDHHGKPRFYLRVPGRKARAAAGAAVVAGVHGGPREGTKGAMGCPAARRQSHQGRHRERRHRVLLPIERVHRRLAESSQRMRRAILERFREAHGDKRIALLHRKALQSDPEQEVAGCRIELAEGSARLHRPLHVPRHDQGRSARWRQAGDRSSQTVITPGSRKSARSSRRTTPSGQGRGWPMSCCCRSGNRAATSCAWAGSMCATEPCR